jgi:hypothetical protein
VSGPDESVAALERTLADAIQRPPLPRRTPARALELARSRRRCGTRLQTIAP